MRGDLKAAFRREKSGTGRDSLLHGDRLLTQISLKSSLSYIFDKEVSLMLGADAVASLREKLNEFGEAGAVPPPLAQRLIEASAWWLHHPQSPTRAPGFSERVVRGPHGWEVEFGGNYFLVERAILLSKRSISDALERAVVSSSTIDGTRLRKRLNACVRESVAKSNHEEYDYYRGGAPPEMRQPRYIKEPLPDSGTIQDSETASNDRVSNRRVIQLFRPVAFSEDAGFMTFGTQAIKIGDFVDEIWRQANLDSFCL
ncbi:hypothetical protein DNFV4_01803 [Nitrospira tepida]|uniref:Uncharacterized protein n=1 Tax=Nitrospira tepida TaxID=2973512 RepID=A0AA86MYQ3_9BACT|nr:hypothetical protein DNFV4_01803 [Nitrospira tepida]